MSREKTLDELILEDMIRTENLLWNSVFKPSPPPNPKEVDDGEGRDD